jgi:hypothetical protein
MSVQRIEDIRAHLGAQTYGRMHECIEAAHVCSLGEVTCTGINLILGEAFRNIRRIHLNPTTTITFQVAKTPPSPYNALSFTSITPPSTPPIPLSH